MRLVEALDADAEVLHVEGEVAEVELLLESAAALAAHLDDAWTER